ncbi:Fatty acid oxidation complex subunit alpha [Cupriavidus yeoncheonensis]|uniref:Fatty acid oxidation complex subunit alpha n=1 Tax=Cupriavidus yeoncheonensis TaxID=1462994 RepID=A0A916IN73_9BURK|nr:enoyl-CoA hydratase/isomerase family protein [Cupriavidus yeoncheonensis]CAG2127119.1 Fatty acid oxidation complex subunit alpha [Cupriavidus yeoncheonensis]
MKSIRFERKGPVGNIVLANPPYNRLDTRFAECLEEAVREASQSDIRVLVVRAEGPNFSLGGEVREWPGKDLNWFRTFVAHVNRSYRTIEGLRVPTVAVVQGAAFGGGFELALSCDFIVAASDARFQCVEVTTAMLPIAGALQRLAERVGRSRASRFAMLGEPIAGSAAAELGIATHVADPDSLDRVANELIARLADGPTLSYAATRTLLKAWSGGGVAAADVVMLDVTMGLYETEDANRGFASTARAFDADEVPPDMVFYGR